MSVVAGTLVAAIVTPAVAVTGVAASESLSLFDNLPGYITPDTLAEKTNIYATDSAGGPVLLASVFDQDREEVGWDHISPHVKDAVIATEDPRFYEHGGVDIASTLRAAIGNTTSGAVKSGASTISMQYVKNILVQRAEAITDEIEREAAYEEATQTSMDRKLKEMKLAIGLEKEYSKDDILLGYLNIVPFGGRVYGIESASQYYYGVSAAGLTLAQAASLVAIVNEPNGLRIDDPDNVADNQARRDADVLASMLRENRITAAQYDEAIATPVTPAITQQSTGCSTANELGAGFFCDYVTHIIRTDPVFGADEDTRWQNFKRGGYDVFTTLDVDLQIHARDTMNGHVPKSHDSMNLGSSLVTVQPGTGKVLTMMQNKDYSADPDVTAATPTATAINYSTDFTHGGSTGFQVGSTYKVFTLAEWLKNGHSLNDVVNGSKRSYDLSTFQNSCTDGYRGSYSPANDGGYDPGRVSVLRATEDSINNAFIAMAQRLDQCQIKNTAEAFGIHRADGQPLDTNVADILGTQEIAPLTMAAAFAGIANNGTYCSPIAIDRILDRNGTPIDVPTTTCQQAVEPQIAATLLHALQSVIDRGTATRSNPRNGLDHFGKTGTTDYERDTWFVGGTTTLSTAVWVGNVDDAVSLRRVTVGGTGGTSVRHDIWRTFMSAADAQYGGNDFPAPTTGLTKPSSLSPTPPGFLSNAGLPPVDESISPGTVAGHG